MNPKTAAFLISLLFFIRPATAQDLSNKGKDFWIAYAGHIDGTTSRMALYITSDLNATGVVDINGSTISFSVMANQVTTVQLTNSSNPSNSLAYNSQVEGIGSKKGIHLTADRPVAVYAHILNAARSGSTLVLPTSVLGKEYYVASYKSSSPGTTRRSQFNVVATTDNTTVLITPTQADGNNMHPANVPFTINLSKGDVYQYQSDEDLTGTYIKSIGTGGTTCQPIAVFSGSTFTSMGCPSANSGDNLYQQLFPFASWGKVYYTAPFIFRAFDIFRILVQDPTEPVYVNGVALNPSTLIAGRFYEINTQGNNTPRIITSGKPVCVLQYMITQSCDGVESDPEMVILNPVEQTLNDITVMSARNNLTPPNTNITSHYLNIIFKTNSLNSLRIDAAPPTATPVVITGTAYSYVQQNVTASTSINPAHRITSDSGFICIAYGYGNVESYGYNAGANVKDLYQFVSIQNQFATVNFPSTCRNTPFFFSMTFPYQPTEIKWVFGTALNALGISDVTVGNPVFDSTWFVNGKQLYRYRIATPYNINTIGTYPIRVLAQNPTPDGCSGEQEINYDVQVFERPVAGFNITSSGCVSDSVRFTDNSNTFTQPSIRWNWNFDDGQASAIKNPAHLFTTANTYNVKYSVVTDIGCVSDTITKAVTLSQPPVAKFGVSLPSCAGKSITVSDSSTSSSTSIVKWTWNFGDNSAPLVATTNAAQTHSYVSPGVYTISLVVENGNGCKSIAGTKTVTVSANPVVGFSFGKGCLPNAAIQFSDASTISDGTQGSFTYNWNFGDGGVSQLKNPVHNFATVGPNTVSLLVISNAGCRDSVTKTVDSVFAQPVSKFSAPAETCFGNAVNFSDQSTSQNSTITSWQWNFGDGTQASSGQNPSHTYSAPGNYNVTLLTTTAAGCVSIAETKQIIINALPTANFTPSSPTCVNGSINFVDNSLANSGTLNKWTWNFGDGSPVSNQPSPAHVYNTTGSFPVSLQVETNKGCVSTILSKQISINPLPVPGFVMPGNCVNDAITQFTDTSSIADGTAGQFTYLWSFGDQNANAANPNSSVVKDASHKYIATGNYDVTLTVTSSSGCIATKTQKFTINGAVPVSSFTVQNGNQQCSNDSVSINDNSTVTPGSLVKLEIYWDYNGDQSLKTVVNNPVPGASYRYKYPNFFAPATKTYVVRMVSYSGITCQSFSEQAITVKAIPEVNFPTIAAICADAPSFQVQANVLNMTGGTGVFTGTGISTSGLFNPGVAGQGNFIINYTYTGTNGCKNSTSQNVNIFPVPTINAGPDRFVLEGGTATINTSASGSGLSYLWTPATYLSSSTAAKPVVTPQGDITYTVVVTSADGCSASDQVLVTMLKSLVIPNVFSPNGDGINDKWDVKYLESYPGATVDIFNRYGQKVFQSVGYSKPWDGTYNGNQVPAGTYYYIINPKNGRQQLAGYVDVIR